MEDSIKSLRLIESRHKSLKPFVTFRSKDTCFIMGEMIGIWILPIAGRAIKERTGLSLTLRMVRQFYGRHVISFICMAYFFLLVWLKIIILSWSAISEAVRVSC